jgi:predicted amidophosphoribosyltransferase
MICVMCSSGKRIKSKKVEAKCDSCKKDIKVSYWKCEDCGEEYDSIRLCPECMKNEN